MHTVLHIGAGQASELPQWLEAGAQHIVLVEPHPELAEQLRQQANADPRVTVVEAAITCDPANNQLHEYNLPEASSLRRATGLKRLFPGLKTLNTYRVATLTPEQLLEQYGPAQGEPATLILQAPGEEQAIIQALAEAQALGRFQQLQLTTNPEPLYEGSVAGETLLNTLQTLGYNIQQENHQDPDWSTWQLARDPQQDKIAALEQSLDALEQQLAAVQKAHKAEAEKQQQQNQQHQAERTRQAEQLSALEQQLTHTKKQKAEAEQRAQAAEQSRKQAATELEEAKKAAADNTEALNEAIKTAADTAQALEKARQQLKEAQQTHKTEAEKQQQQHKAREEQLTAELEDHKQWFRSRKAQAEELQAQNLKLETELEQLTSALEATRQLKQEVQQSQSAGQNALAALEQKMEHLFSQQVSQIQQATNALGQHITRSYQDQRQHIHNVASLEHYFETGTQPLEFGQWAIGADLAGHLVRAIEQNNYDLIIEFGSGTSTVLLARSVLNRTAPTAANASDRALEQESYSERRTAVASYDLPQRILSFEQNSTYQQKTATALAREGLSHLVNLVLAPLVPTVGSDHQNNALFYDCHTQLARIAQLYEGRQARMLVLVDGPHSPEGNPLIREPALNCLLQHLSAHQLDVVLDDALRQGEQQIIQRWQHSCQQRGLSHSYQLLNTEKGAAWFTIAP